MLGTAQMSTLAAMIDPGARKRAQDYLDSVDIYRRDARGVRARVQGADLYSVVIETERRLAVGCTCPYFESAGPCKHIWATALVAQGKGVERRSAWRESLAAIDGGLARRRRPRADDREIVYLLEESSYGFGLVVEAAGRRPNRSKPSRLRLSVDDVDGLPDAADREALALLSMCEPSEYGGSWRVELRDPIPASLIELVCRTGRSFLKHERELTGLAWDGGAPWQLRLHMKEELHGYQIDADLARGDERMELSAVRLFLSGGLMIAGDRVTRIDHGDASPWIERLRQEGPLRVPRRDALKAAAAILAMPLRATIELPPELRFDEVSASPRPRLRVEKPGRGSYPANRLVARAAFEYAGATVAPTDAQPTLVIEKERQLIRRDLEAEHRAMERLERAGLKWQHDYQTNEKALTLAPRALPEVVRGLTADGWLVEAEGRLYRAHASAKLEITSGIDWFDVAGKIDYGGQVVGLPELLAAVRRGEDMVPLDDGSLGLIPEEWLRRVALLESLAERKGGGLRFRRGQATLLDALLAEHPEATWDTAAAKARAELARFERVEPVDPPAGFAGELRDYQRQGLGWLHFLRRMGFGGCLADDMGLGKTVQILALLESRRTSGKPSLVVVPRSLVFNWKAEAARFAPRLRILDHTGAARPRTAAELAGHHVVLTTYGTLRRDVPWLKDVDLDYAVLDEAQAVKNAGSDSAKAVRLLRAEHRLALSGTPIENHLGELWSLFEFLNPGLLGAASVFRDRVARAPDEATRAVLARALRPFLLRRTKEQVAPDLPAKVEQTLHCELDAAERRRYDELRDHYRQALKEGDLGRSKLRVLEALLRLRQAACHPGLVDPGRAGEPGTKVELVLEKLQQVLGEGHKALVFSQFTSLLAIVRARLDSLGIAYEYLDGQTRDRQARVTRFQESGVQLFLISLKAGGVGLNLTAADYVFLLDPWWNPAVEAQAIDRTHRIGQDKPVFAYRIIARDTVEEKILELQAEKRALADGILAGDSALLRDLTKEDLERLLS